MLRQDIDTSYETIVSAKLDWMLIDAKGNESAQYNNEFIFARQPKPWSEDELKDLTYKLPGNSVHPITFRAGFLTKVFKGRIRFIGPDDYTVYERVEEGSGAATDQLRTIDATSWRPKIQLPHRAYRLHPDAALSFPQVVSRDAEVTPLDPYDVMGAILLKSARSLE